MKNLKKCISAIYLSELKNYLWSLSNVEQSLVCSHHWRTSGLSTGDCDSCPRVPQQPQPLHPRTETPHEPVQAPESHLPEI